MNYLTFENVENGIINLVYTIPTDVGTRYEDLTSFTRGRDFNQEIKRYMKDFVRTFSNYLTPQNEEALNNRLLSYNKLVVELRTAILRATTIPSVMICGGGNYPTKRKQKELERIERLERELYSKDGKHEKFLTNTRKMFDPIYQNQKANTQKMQKERASENNWTDFFSTVEHSELEGYGIDIENNRVYIKTYDKPSEELRTLLKASALRWSPKNMRWQRVLTQNAIYTLESRLFEKINLPVTATDFINQ